MQTTQSVTEDRLFVRPREACRLASIGLTRLYELINAGTVESRKLGSSRLISVESLRRLGHPDTQEAG